MLSMNELVCGARMVELEFCCQIRSEFIFFNSRVNAKVAKLPLSGHPYVRVLRIVGNVGMCLCQSCGSVLCIIFGQSMEPCV